DHEVAALARFTAFAAPGGTFHAVHTRAQDSLGAEHADVAHHASATAEGAWATAVLMDSVGENLHGEFALDKLDGKIFLATRRVDDVQTVAKGACTLTDTDAIDKQGKLAALGIEGAQHVDNVVASTSWRGPIGSLGKIAHNAV